jgi:hypothetical protein
MSFLVTQIWTVTQGPSNGYSPATGGFSIRAQPLARHYPATRCDTAVLHATSQTLYDASAELIRQPLLHALI